jgi:hypothetical protein
MSNIEECLMLLLDISGLVETMINIVLEARRNQQQVAPILMFAIQQFLNNVNFALDTPIDDNAQAIMPRYSDPLIINDQMLIGADSELPELTDFDLL